MTGWYVDSMDGFDVGAEIFELSGPYDDEQSARIAATIQFLHLESVQPKASSGGQKGVQDRLYLRHPDGKRERLFS